MRPTDLNTFHLCLCFVDFTLRFPFLLLVVFPLFFSTQFLAMRFLFIILLLFNIVYTFPLGHIYRALRMYAYLPSRMYTHPR